ncbi:hypothetical protein BU15DRAFT_84453 [Melanogaster broomeanus]|nr:hypothetical protein BU15DRAFT_84453 [Melanogaster broomeanus]
MVSIDGATDADECPPEESTKAKIIHYWVTFLPSLSEVLLYPCYASISAIAFLYWVILTCVVRLMTERSLQLFFLMSYPTLSHAPLSEHT